MRSELHSSALRKILSSSYRNNVINRICRSKPARITHAKGLRSYFAIDCVYVFKTRFRKKTSQVSATFHNEFVQCYCIMLFNKEQETTAPRAGEGGYSLY